jgi:hypothetical protein
VGLILIYAHTGGVRMLGGIHARCDDGGPPVTTQIEEDHFRINCEAGRFEIAKSKLSL